MINREEICARLCLLTRAAWQEELPPVLTRRMARRLFACGAAQSLVLRDVPGVEQELLERARALLGRARQVYACMEDYEEQGYSILIPQDEAWPRRLLSLGGEMPQFLFVMGNQALLSRRMAALAGSRSILPQTMHAAYECGKRMAEEGLVMVCGGAQGVDSAAQQGLLEAGGSLILVPALSVHQLLRDTQYAQALGEGRLLLVCDTLPDEPFSAQKALARNHTIYALGEAAVVIAARDQAGGSWQGAMDCLRGGWTDVFALDDGGEDTAGCRVLLERGAKRMSLELALRPQLFAGVQACQMDMLGSESR